MTRMEIIIESGETTCDECKYRHENICYIYPVLLLPDGRDGYYRAMRCIQEAVKIEQPLPCS